MQWKKIQHPKGIRYREHPSRKNGPHRDRYYIFRFMCKGQIFEGGRGWTSEGYTLDWIEGKLREFKANAKAGQKPRNFAEEDQLKAEKEAAEKAVSDAARQEEAMRQRYTLRALCDEYVTLLETKRKRKSAGATRSAFKCHIYTPFPEIADTPAKDVTPQQIATIIRKVANAGKTRTAGVLRSYLSASFNAGKKAPFDANLPSSLIPFGIESNPVEPIATIPVKRGDRALSPEELKNYLAHLNEADVIDASLKLALLAGGQRVAQLLRIKVSDYDLQAKTIRLLDTKGKRNSPREHLLPLGPAAAEIMESLLGRANSRGSQYLFSSRGNRVHEATPGKRVAEISAKMEGEKFDLRDIRRTVETILAGLGISRDVRAQLLSHGISGVQAAHYDRHEYMKEKAATLRKWERFLERLTKGKAKGKIVALK